MTRALIKVNGTDGSNDNLPINTLVTLGNDGNGGESTYLWSILDQPAGAADALSSTSVASPTLTPEKEGTYLLQLVVNQGLSDEARDTAIVGVRQVKSLLRVPAALETTEDDPATGWKAAVNTSLQRLTDVLTDANVVAAVASASLAIGAVVQFTATATIKTGLPGVERLPSAALSSASAAGTCSGVLGVVVGTPAGGAPNSGDVALVRVLGLAPTTPAGAPSPGDPVYLSNAGLPSLTVGTVTRVIGRALDLSGGNYRWFVNGLGSP